MIGEIGWYGRIDIFGMVGIYYTRPAPSIGNGYGWVPFRKTGRWFVFGKDDWYIRYQYWYGRISK